MKSNLTLVRYITQGVPIKVYQPLLTDKRILSVAFVIVKGVVTTQNDAVFVAIGIVGFTLPPVVINV